MKKPKKMLVLYGGVNGEREVSLRSGATIAKALRLSSEVELLRLDSEEVPDSIDGSECVAFPGLHGSFGEDGRLQALLDSRGVVYCGSDAASSQLCMSKDRTKLLAQELGICVPECLLFDGSSVPLADTVIGQLGASLVLKPSDQGSSVGLFFTEHRSALGVALSKIDSGSWMIERRIRGRELTVGVLRGEPMGVVEILSSSGVFDYAAKYTPGVTAYRYPAELGDALTAEVRSQAAAIFKACGCRDFARIDFLLEGETPYFLEVNTLPGMTETSLLPKSASCIGLDFNQLVAAMAAPALERFAAVKGAGA